MTSSSLHHGLLVPGFGGGATQPLLLKLQKSLLAAGLSALPVALKKGRPAPTLATETQELLGFYETLVQRPGFIIGRSFGARVAIRLAQRTPVSALVLLGFPLRPEGKRRLMDEEVFASLAVPTLVLQGENDELGSPELVRSFASPSTLVEVVPGAGHSFGKHEKWAVTRTTEWLSGLAG